MRREVARQLHDDLAQLVLGARLQLEGVSRRRGEDEASRRLRGVLDELAARAQRMVAELRAPPARGPLALELERLLSEFQALGLQVELLVDDLDELAEADEAQVETLLATAREGLTNALRHGEATEATVSVNAEPDALVLRVVDNGGGRASQVQEGHGLLGIRERVEGLGGRTLLSDGEVGLRLEVRVPVRTEGQAS